jgi:hypothetical protein
MISGIVARIRPMFIIAIAATRKAAAFDDFFAVK